MVGGFHTSASRSVAEEPEGGESTERRLITCLFLDVVGSTEFVRRLGPDRMDDELRRTFAGVREIVASHGGSIEKYLGDGILAVFGAPIAHGDDTERALRAAAACLSAVERRRLEGMTIEVRVGVETGTALVGTNPAERRPEHTLVGACVNMAERLQQAATPGQVLVGPGCHEAAAAAAEFEDGGRLPLKGLGEVNVWRLVRILESHPATHPPFVGRSNDLEIVRSAFQRAKEGRGTEVIILGPPGQGKSRLVEEFIEEARRDVTLLTARCRPDDETGARTPLRQLLAVDDQGPTPSGVMERLVPLIPDATDRERVKEALCHSAGLEVVPRFLGIRATGREGEFADGWRRFLNGLAQLRTVVVWIDDLHWAEPNVVRLFDRLTDANPTRLLVVATARPELGGSADLRPGPDHLQIELGPLDPNAIEALAKSVGTNVGTDIARAHGNPLFVLEMARSPGPVGEVPMTIQAAIGARLDELPGEERELVRRAAVVGESFTVRDVALLAARPPADVAGALARLAHLQYLTSDDGRYVFHHGLVRDVAYGRLGTAERLRLHARYAQEGVDPADSEILAHHWWEALGGPDAEWVWRADPDLPGFRHEALRAQMAAARRHSARASFDHARQICARATAFATTPAELAEVHELLASIHVFQSDGDRAWVEWQTALAAYRTKGLDPPAHLYAEATRVPTSYWGFFRHLPDSSEVLALLDEGIRVARSEGGSVALADLLAQRSHFNGTVSELSEVLQLVDAAPNASAYADILPQAVAAQLMAGYVDAAIDTNRRIDSLIASGASINEPEALLWRILAYYEAGNLAEADRHARRFQEVSGKRSAHLQTHALGAISLVRSAQGGWDEARVIAERVADIVRRNPHLGFCLVGASALAWGSAGRILAGLGLEPSLRELVARMVPESLPVTASTLFLPCAMVGEDDLFVPARDGFGILKGEWHRQEWDPYGVNMAIGLTILGRWNDLEAYLSRLREVAAHGAQLPGAVAEAVVEERESEKGGPRPHHASLHRLGYFGLSQLLSFRARRR